MPTRLIGTWENKTIVAEIDYDASDRITTLRFTNDSDMDVYAEAVQTSNGRKYSKKFLAHTTSEITIPIGVASRLVQLWDPVRSRWHGIDFSVLVPSP